MPAGCASISGIARSTFDLNSGRFLPCRFTQETLSSRGVAPIRSSFFSRWSVTIYIYVRAIRIPAINSAEGQRIGFLRAVKISLSLSLREPKGNSGNKMESPILRRVRFRVFRLGSPFVLLASVFVTRRGQTDNSIPFHESHGEEKRFVWLRSIRE